MMKRKDLILILIIAAVALGGMGAARLMEPGDVSQVRVTVDGAVVLTAPLSKDATYEIPQDDGSLNVIEVKDGGVRMIDANCRDGVCISQGETRRATRTIVCLPHKLVVQLVPAEESEDADEGQGAPSGDLDVVVF